jgi:shikimate dehydrogenase
MTDRSGGARHVLLGLIGSPIQHSASPAMHEAAAAALGWRCYYHLVEIAGADEARLRAMLGGVRTLGFAGINVTYPYKEIVPKLLDRLSPGAARIGAVNTVVVEGGRLVGHNTDASGFARACQEMLGDLEGQTVALIGAGGVGRASAIALADLGVAALRLVDRDAAKAEALAASLAPHMTVEVSASIADALDGADGLVNGTPVGMLPNRDTPVPSELLHPDLWVADAVYTPLWTPLLLAARARGCRVMTGREFNIFQAMDAFRLFTGAEPSRDAMSAAFDAVMARRAAAQEVV